MATEEELLTEWYEALRKEDSLRVQELLADHPGLLNVGWGEEASKFQWKAKPWKQRTALHVGVKRGNVELVEQVLILCELNIPELSRANEPDQGSSASTSNKGQTEVGEIEDAGENASNIADPSLDDTPLKGDRQLGKLTQSASYDGKPGETSGIQTAVSSSSGSKREGDDKIQEMAGLAVAKSQRHGDDTGFVQDATFLRRLLLAKDGEYDLDAIAIASLLVNVRIVHLIFHAMGKCELHGVRTSWLAPLNVTEETETDRRSRKKLREITEQVVQSFGAWLVKLYEYHPDFNFLPWQEYLFHFLFDHEDFRISLAIRQKLGKALWRAFRSCPDSTWWFVLELLDGQGRTPIHVAFLRSSFVKAVLANDKGEIEDKAVLECVMAARDGAGRTALHRALATGDYDMINDMLTWSHYPFVELINAKVREPWIHSIWNVAHALGFGRRECEELLRIVSRTNGFNGSSVFIRAPPIQSSPLYNAIIHKHGRCLLWSKEFLPASETVAGEAGATPKTNLSLLWSKMREIFHTRASVLWQAAKCGSQHRKREEAQSKRTLVSINQESMMREILYKRVDVLWQATKSGFHHRKRHEAKKKRTKVSLQQESMMWEYWGLDDLFPWRWYGVNEWKHEFVVDAVELAAFVGDAESVRSLPLGAYNKNSKSKSSRTWRKQPWPALHIAANAGNYEMVKVFLDDPLCDPYSEDFEGNTALHHALNLVTIGKFEPDLLDYVNCKHIQSIDPRVEKHKEIVDVDQESKAEKNGDEDTLVDRQGCINLLLEAGCDIFKTNDNEQPPFPQGELSKNSKFRSWWYERQAKEFDATQRTLSSAANAVSVIATLVATASYVGPLQPPMGLAGDPSQIQDGNLWVRIFIVCDTMSFYFAIIAITLSLLPSIPMPQQRMKDEVRRTRRMLGWALATIFPSVIFVLVAFVSSSMAVVSVNVTSTGGWLTITTASVGGIFCLVTFTLFFSRLLAFLYPRSKWVRKIYNYTSF